ncbi:MAG: cysteine dioxygenase [Pseudomonadota bacterium]
MSVKQKRDIAVRETVEQIKELFRDGVSVPLLNEAKSLLVALCAKKELFPRDDFPLPDGEPVYRTFLIHQDEDGGNALYVNSSLPGQTSCPHDHGGSWAIIAAVAGEEAHRFYVADDDGALHQVGERVVKPGTAVSMMPDGIHAIEMTKEEPLLHLHLYGLGFHLQKDRRQFDLETGTVSRFAIEYVGLIEDAR